jgi:mono/diheme cytochrome c family protein
MSGNLLIGYYFAAAAVAFFLILWMLGKPSDEDTDEDKNLSVALPHFHHTGAYLSGAIVLLTATFLAFSNYSIGTTRQWFMIDMFDSTMVKPYEAPMGLPVDGTISSRYVENHNRFAPEAANLVAPEGTDAANGKRMYNTYCAPCHAAEGKGNGLAAKRSGTIPGIALSGSAMKTDGYLYLTIRNGSAIMPGYSWAMADSEMWDVVAYLRSLFPAPEPVAEGEE